MLKNFNVRLSDADADMLQQVAADRGTSCADVLRDAVHAYLTGAGGQLAGTEAGYASGRALASQLAFELLREAHGNMPEDYKGAVAWLAKRRTAEPSAAARAKRH